MYMYVIDNKLYSILFYNYRPTPVCIIVCHVRHTMDDTSDVHADIFLLLSYTTKDISQPAESDTNMGIVFSMYCTCSERSADIPTYCTNEYNTSLTCNHEPTEA